ncbi:MAG: hypothetical protein H7833_17970 [Magnetococcus sp. DMHC-1]
MEFPTLDVQQRRLIQAIQGGFPIVSHPYREIGQTLGISEEAVIAGVAELQQLGIIKRMGIVVRHHELGYQANAMVVWDIPEAELPGLANKICAYPFVHLCYQRQRVIPEWPYNLYCMIHGRQRHEVLEQVGHLMTECGLRPYPHKILFSNRRFKQRGARYLPQSQAAAVTGT